MLLVAATFTHTSGTPATGLTLADIDLYLTRRHKTTGTVSVVWDGTQNPTQEMTNIGMYVRAYTSEDPVTYNYAARGSYTGATALDVDHVTGLCLLTPDEISYDVFAQYAVEGAFTLEEMLRIMYAVLANRSGGGGTLTLNFRDLANAKNRVVATVDASGNRLNVVVDGT